MTYPAFPDRPCPECPRPFPWPPFVVLAAFLGFVVGVVVG